MSQIMVMTLSSEHTYKQKRKELVLGDIDDNDDEMGDVVDDEENLIFVCYFIVVLLHIAIAAKLNRVNQMMMEASLTNEQLSDNDDDYCFDYQVRSVQCNHLYNSLSSSRSSDQ